MEYGFYRELVAAGTTTVFYFSNNANCGNQGSTDNPPLCHVADDITSALINEDTSPDFGPNAQPHGVGISNLRVNGADATDSSLYYSAYIVPDLSGPNGYRFQVEVVDPGAYTLATCDVSGLFVGQLCSFPVYPAAWYRIDQLYSTSAVGYATIGVQRAGTPTVDVDHPVVFHVDQLNVGKK